MSEDQKVELQELAAIVGALAPLSARECQVAAMVARGFRDKQIAAALRISPKTVAAHVVTIAARAGIPGGHHTRVLIARWWWHHDLPDFDAAS